MKASLARLSAAVSVLGLIASPAMAQMWGNPVYFSPKQAVGLTIAGDYGRGLNNASEKTNYFGGRATLGLPMVAITVGGGTEKPSGTFTGENTPWFGGDVAATVLKGPVVPVSVSLQAGAAYSSKSGYKQLRAPLGVALAFNVKSPGASVEPWIGPRVDILHVSGTGITSATETHVGASAGLNVGLPSGVGFHVALDYLYVKAPAGGGSSSDYSPFVVGAGIHYTIKIPSLVPGTGM
jgi:hypothetical protein